MSRLLQRMKAVISVGAHLAINTAARILTALDSQMVELCMKKQNTSAVLYGSPLCIWCFSFSEFQAAEVRINRSIECLEKLTNSLSYFCSEGSRICVHVQKRLGLAMQLGQFNK